MLLSVLALFFRNKNHYHLACGFNYINAFHLSSYADKFLGIRQYNTLMKIIYKSFDAGMTALLWFRTIRTALRPETLGFIYTMSWCLALPS